VTEQQPGMFPDRKTAAEKIGLWVGLGAFVWLILLGLLWMTVVVARHLF
jgi:hypothetical protein